MTPTVDIISDMDECKDGSAGCHTGADCFNTEGSSRCQCKPGKYASITENKSKCKKPYHVITLTFSKGQILHWRDPVIFSFEGKVLETSFS